MSFSKGRTGQAKHASYNSNFGNRPTSYLDERARIRKENDEKTARLKALRLAKEARELAEAPPVKVATKRSRKKNPVVAVEEPTN